MKKKFIMKMITICGVVLFTFSCKPTCNIKIPKGVKPIDWENYNDVYTVFWNCVKDCNKPHNDTGSEIISEIKIYGWIFQGHLGKTIYPGNFALISNEEDIFYPNFSTRGGTGIYIRVAKNNYEEECALIDSLKIKFAGADITKRCYIRGNIFLTTLPTNNCCTTAPEIIIDSVDDIKFEEE